MAPAWSRPPATILFLHGLDSSTKGTKAQWFRAYFPQVGMRDYHGELGHRLTQLEEQTAGVEQLILVGSSFGGLMAACFAARHPERCRRLVLLAPALNFNDYRPPPATLAIPVFLAIGAHDTVCPPDLVIPLARAAFDNLEVRLADDDHLLHRTFPCLDWPALFT
ncbi:alpha/beta fold hydrolase [Desulfobulbus sp.]|uniref:alpha/beta hydrolase n=1 Tax=Desulfobulbus sp. TaxID=895 RepID=UPI00286F0FB6|nr:alpha/beta fold hydrolase [Desulfobulbus sp.]